MDRSVHVSLREEIQLLRRKIVLLETAEADNEKLRKELSRVKNQMHDEKSQMELEFMNQVSAVARENAYKMEEIEGRLKESNKVKSILNEQLDKLGGPEGVEKRLQEVEARQRAEIARIIDRKIEEAEKAQQELKVVETSRDEHKSQLEDTCARLEAYRAKVEELTASKAAHTDADIDSIKLKLATLEQENSKLVSELQNLDNQKGVVDDQSSDVRLLREKLRARDSELNSKISEIRKMESELKAAKSHSMAFSVLQEENRGLKRDLESLNLDRTEKDATIARLEKENRDLKGSLVRIELEKKEIPGNLRESSKFNRIEADTNVSRLERENLDLRQSMIKLENEHKELEASRQIDATTSIGSQRNRDTGPTGNRTSQIIKQLESNFKREGQLKHNVTAAIKSRTNNDRANEFKINSLKTDIKSLTQQLEDEREGTRLLRREIQTLKKGTGSGERVSRSSLGAKNNSNGVKNIDVILPPLRKADDTEARAAVRGIVDSIELKIWRNQSDSASIRRLMNRLHEYPELADDLEELKDELEFEREQVLELEDELTRQCEINCTLLKEISNLTSENESSRKSQSQTYGILTAQNYGDDQKEIDRLMMEIANVKSQLFTSEQSKTMIQTDQNHLIEKYKLEVNTLKKHLAAAEAAKDMIRLRMEESSMFDKEEIDRLLIKVDFLQRKLDIAETTLIKLEDADSFSEKDVDVRLNVLRKDFEKSQKDDQETIDRYKIRISELEADLSKAKDLHTEYKSKSRQQIESLNSMVEALQANLVNADESSASLARDKENLVAEVKYMSERMVEAENRAKEQQEQLEKLQRGVDVKINEFEILRNDDKEHIQRLKDQVTSLEQELSKTLDNVERLTNCLQEKEEMENTVDELARKNVQSLHAQINKLQKEMTNKQVEVSEAETENQKKVSALEDLVDALQMEMEESFEEREKEIGLLRNSIEEKEGNILRLEREKEQLVLSMNDMMKTRRAEIDELQSELMEMSTRTANQAREVQTLKLQLEESKYRKDEMDRLRARVTDLGDQLASRRHSCGVDNSALEVEISELRERLLEATAERQIAEDKLRDYVADKGGSSKSIQVLRERNAALKYEVEKLTKKLKKAAPDNNRMPDSQRQRMQEPNAVEATRFAI